MENSTDSEKKRPWDFAVIDKITQSAPKEGSARSLLNVYAILIGVFKHEQKFRLSHFFGTWRTTQ